MKLSASVFAALIAKCVVAHGGLNNYTVGETWYRGYVRTPRSHHSIPFLTPLIQLPRYDPFTPAEDQLGQPWQVQRAWETIDPVFNVSSPFLACNTPGTTAAATIDIQAGENITALYFYWLHPVGPMSVWLAACPQGGGCADVDVNELDWFKIWHAGLVDDGALGLAESMWYQKAFQKWDNSPAEWPVQIPSTLKPGMYLVRHEIMSIHVAGKPQFYPECAHLNVSGTGMALPPREYYKKIPGVYSMDGELE